MSNGKKSGKLLSAPIILLTFAHLFNDFYAGFLIPLLSYFQSYLHLTITQVSLLPTVLAVFGSILQPVFGFFGDRLDRKKFVVTGVLCSAIFMSSICVAPCFIILVLMLIIGSSGVASFHPNGAVSVADLSNNKSAFVMSLFLMAGSIGLAGAPFIITSFVSFFEINKIWFLSLPGIILGVILIKALPAISCIENKAKMADLQIIFTRESRPLWILFFIMFLRSIVITGFMSFMSILFAERGLSIQKSGIAISIFLISGTIGGLIGGYLADNVNKKIIIAVSSILACPLLIWFLHESEVCSMVLLGLSGLVVFAAAPVNVLIVQSFYPGMASAVSGIAMGFVWGAAGLMLPLIGSLADRYSMGISLKIVTLLAPVAGLLVFLLPNINNHARQIGEEIV